MATDMNEEVLRHASLPWPSSSSVARTTITIPESEGGV